MDFYDPEDIKRFYEMDREERVEATQDWLASVAEPWQGDSDEDAMARSMIAAMNAYLQAAYTIDDFRTINRHVLGLWTHGYIQMARNFQTLSAMSQIKKRMEES
jgi:hypothetical protein